MISEESKIFKCVAIMSRLLSSRGTRIFSPEGVTIKTKLLIINLIQIKNSRFSFFFNF